MRQNRSSSKPSRKWYRWCSKRLPPNRAQGRVSRPNKRRQRGDRRWQAARCHRGAQATGALLQAPKGTAASAAGAFDNKKWTAAKTHWQDAIETVDRQVAALQKELLKTGDGDLKEIAEFGLNGVTGNHKVPLMAAIRDVDGAAPEVRSKAANQALSRDRQVRESHQPRRARLRL